MAGVGRVTVSERRSITALFYPTAPARPRRGSEGEGYERLHRVGPPDPPGGQPLGDQKGELEGLVAVQPGIAERLVPADQIGLDQVVAAADALGDVVAGELDVHAARPGAELLVDV